MFNNTIVLGK